jgi:hypothetical protein
VHEFPTSYRTLRGVHGFAPSHGAGHPFACSMGLFHEGVKVFDRAERERGPRRLRGALAGGGMGVTAVQRARLGDTMPAPGHLEQPSGGLWGTRSGAPKVHGRAVFVDGALELALLALDRAVGLVQPPNAAASRGLDWMVQRCMVE